MSQFSIFCAASFTVAAFVLSGAITGCGRTKALPPALPPARVSVSTPVEKDVTDYADFTGQTVAVGTVQVRARVWGYLDKMSFREGALVKKGDLLFQIDPRPYKAALDAAKAKATQDEAQLRHQEAAYQRSLKLRKSGAVSPDELDQALADRDAMAATLEFDRSEVAQRQLDLDFTRVLAPIDGRVGRAEVTEGNVVQSGQSDGTLLTTIVTTNPTYVEFDVDERTMLQVRRRIGTGEVASASDSSMPVWMGLSDEQGFPRQGKINFVDNRVDPSTGTLRLRGVFPNEDGALLPGVFVRVRFPFGEPYRSILVSEQALGSDQGQKFVYVVNEKNEITYRAVTTGRLHDGMRVIRKGLEKGEKVVVTGLQRVRPGMPVEATVVEMPTLAKDDARPSPAAPANSGRTVQAAK